MLLQTNTLKKKLKEEKRCFKYYKTSYAFFQRNQYDLSNQPLADIKTTLKALSVNTISVSSKALGSELSSSKATSSKQAYINDNINSYNSNIGKAGAFC